MTALLPNIHGALIATIRADLVAHVRKMTSTPSYQNSILLCDDAHSSMRGMTFCSLFFCNMINLDLTMREFLLHYTFPSLSYGD